MPEVCASCGSDDIVIHSSSREFWDRDGQWVCAYNQLSTRCRGCYLQYVTGSQAMANEKNIHRCYYVDVS